MPPIPPNCPYFDAALNLFVFPFGSYRDSNTLFCLKSPIDPPVRRIIASVAEVEWLRTRKSFGQPCVTAFGHFAQIETDAPREECVGKWLEADANADAWREWGQGE